MPSGLSGAANSTASDEVAIRVNRPPVAEAGPETVTDKLYVTLDGSGSSDADGDLLIHTWDFGDGSPPALGEIVTHAFPRSGVFPVTLTVDDGTGLDNAVAVDSTRVVIDARPVAVAGGNRDVCSGDTILFDGSASSDPDGGLLRYEWDFGDGSRPEIVNPTKTYERPGVYTVTLTVRDESGLPVGLHSDRIAAVVREAPIADAGPPVMTCTGQTVRFDGSKSSDADGAVNAFSWNFGDGTIGGGERPTHVFERPGTYAVTLTITGDSRGGCGSLDTAETAVTVVEAPRIEIVGPDRAAVGVPVSFETALAGSADVSGAEFTWDFGDGTTSSGPTVEHAFAAAGTRTVILRAVLPGANEGCGSIETRRIVTVNAPPEPVIDVPDRVAAGALVLFDASGSRDPDGAITGFDWDLGDGATATGVQAQHHFAEPGSYEVRLAATDDAGVANSRVVARRTIEVSPPPVADLTAPLPLCPGVPHLWSVAEDAAALKASWLFGDGVEAEGPQTDHAFDKPGVFPVAVTLDDGGGLASSRRTEEVYVRANQAPVAVVGPDRIVCPGDPVAFDAGLSADGDGSVTGWRWTFSDGVVLEGPQVERSFSTPGLRQVKLTVTDDSGSVCSAGTDTAAVLVNAPPTVDAGPDRDPPSARRTTRSSSTPAPQPTPTARACGSSGTSATAAARATPSPATASARRATTRSAARPATPPASPAASRATPRPCTPGPASDRMRFPLRAKFFLSATLIATAPLALVGENLVRIARDELKSAANEDLTEVAASVAADFDATVRGRWLTPLLVIRNGVDSDKLGVEQKISLLTLGRSQIPDVVALQLTVAGSDLPILVTDQDFSKRLTEVGLDSVETLRSPVDAIADVRQDGRYGQLLPRRVEATGDWLATVALPLRTEIAGGAVTLSAQIDLAPLGVLARHNPFTRRGEIAVVDADGRTVLEPEPRSLADRAIVANAVPLIVGRARPDAIEGYVRADGEAMLGAYAFPDAFPWAIITELSEASAYAVVNQMLRNLLLVGLVGFGVAAAAALFFARRLTGPILKIGEVATRVGGGDLSARVEGVRTRDEIGDLAGRMNAMIRHLSERLELMKFVSRETVTAIRAAESGVARGGERRRATVFFSDIRGYTAFAEAVAPEVVVEMLNQYLDAQTSIVGRHGGDVDKFIGDEVVAVFQGPEMERDAVACGLEIQRALADLLEEHPDWNLHVGLGIAAGEVVMGAIGARDRLVFTVVGGVVNLAARLCAAASADAILVTAPGPDSARAALLGVLPTAVVLGVLAIAFNISFAAIIYQGELAPFMDRGIALTLLGAAPMAAVGALVLNYRGSVCQPQDTPAILLSLAAAGIAGRMPNATSERSFATIAALVLVTTTASGASPGCSVGCASASSPASSRSR